MNLLWVTSFAVDMFKASGSNLIESFVGSGTEGQLLVCHEGMGEKWQSSSPNVTWKAIDEDPFLLSWLKENADIIPPHLGGSNSGKCTCPKGPFPEDGKGHEPPCICHWMNRNASRWFRKIVALKRACDFRRKDAKKKEAWDAVIWIDSDCLFTKRVTEKPVFRRLNNCSNAFISRACTPTCTIVASR